MAKYRKSFELDLRDIELIESAIRSEIAEHAKHVLIGAKTHDHRTHRVRELHQVLAKIFDQKIFYSQVNSTGVPGG